MKKKPCDIFCYMKYNPSKLEKYTKSQKQLKTSKCCKPAIMDFQIPKFWEFALLNNHYQITKNEGNQNFKLSRPAWSLQKLALKATEATFVEIASEMKNCFKLKDKLNFNVL